MINTQTQIDSLIDLAVIQRKELKQLVESLPQLRDHLSSEIERNLEEIEPSIRAELEQFVAARALDAQAKTSAELGAKIDAMARNLESTTAARYSVIMAERAENANLLAKAEARIAEAASALPAAVKTVVADELSRFPRAGEIDQLRKEFAEPRGLNPRGRWEAGVTYYKLDLVAYNGDSYVANEETKDRPSRASTKWTLNAARGNAGGGSFVNPTAGDYTAAMITNVPSGTISATNVQDAINELDTKDVLSIADGTAAAPSLNFSSETTTGLFRASANVLGVSVAGTSRATFTATGMTVTGTITPSGSVHGANGTAANPSLSFASDQDTGLYRIGANNIGVAVNGAKVLDVGTGGLVVDSIAANAATNLTLAGGTAGTNAVRVTNTTAATLGTLASGSFQTAGGASVSGGLNVGLDLRSGTGTDYAQITTSGGVPSLLLRHTNTDRVSITANGDSTFNGGDVRIGNTNTALKLFVAGTTASTSTTTGALQVAGGVGVAGSIWAGGAGVFGTANTAGSGVGSYGATPSSGVFGFTSGSMTGTNMYGFTDQTATYTLNGAATEVIDHRAYATLALGANALTNWYGFQSTLNSKTGVGVLTNAYAYYASSPTAATNNYAFFSAGTAPSVLGGALTVSGQANFQSTFPQIVFGVGATAVNQIGFLYSSGGQYVGISGNRNPNSGVFANTAGTHAGIDLDTGAGGSAITFRTTSSVNTLGTVALTIASNQAATFTGLVSTPAATTTTAGLRVPHGAAPTSPVNGDIWTTTAGLFVRINGVTVGPLT